MKGFQTKIHFQHRLLFAARPTLIFLVWLLMDCHCFKSATVNNEDRYRRLRQEINQYTADQFPTLSLLNEPLDACTSTNQASSSSKHGDIGDGQSVYQHFLLAVLFARLDGLRWKNRDSWLTDEDVCHWYGIECRDNRITGIYLDYNNLQGGIPSEIGHLTNLQTLSWLGNPNLFGFMPN